MRTEIWNASDEKTGVNSFCHVEVEDDETIIVAYPVLQAMMLELGWKQISEEEMLNAYSS